MHFTGYLRIIKLIKIPIRVNVSDYVKNITFIEKYTKDREFRDAYNNANAAIIVAQNRGTKFFIRK